jgi:hypothetical protein
MRYFRMPATLIAEIQTPTAGHLIQDRLYLHVIDIIAYLLRATSLCVNGMSSNT